MGMESIFESFRSCERKNAVLAVKMSARRVNPSAPTPEVFFAPWRFFAIYIFSLLIGSKARCVLGIAIYYPEGNEITKAVLGKAL